ncbi:MAG TPA: RsmB/NOP family class I SAM-dependent RNA methyltransferase, partial [Gaiellales bacterium]|nr:RsmB/NOP family class I SAM-dependent RNA methyltransferase [Gaiellales bacterium]
YPDWVMEEWAALMGAEGADACAEAQNRPAELCVRVNTLRGDAPKLGVETRAVDGLPEALVLEEMVDVIATEAFAIGAVWPQSRSSMRPARLLDPRPGMRVLDLCAAPGGKSGQLAALIENRGELVCVERHAGRAAELERTLARFGATCARVVRADVLEFAERGFDRILLDPPCSGLGVLAGRPDARWRRTPEDAAELAGLQRAMIDHARGLLAPHGVLVYSVCTLRRDECERVLPGGDYLLPQTDRSDGFYIAAAGA